MNGKEKFFGTWRVIHADNPALTDCCMTISDDKGNAVQFEWECPGDPDRFPPPWDEVPCGSYYKDEVRFVLPDDGKGTPYRMTIKDNGQDLYCSPEEEVFFSQAGGNSQGTWTAEDESGAARRVA